LTASEKILKKHSLRHTECRTEVLSHFLNKSVAISHTDLEEVFDKKFDRVTLYRTLKSFLEHGIIHKVLDNESTPKYAVCAETCEVSHHRHDHVHFKCTQCLQTQCIENVHFPHFTAPEGFIFSDVNVLITGICKDCNK